MNRIFGADVAPSIHLVSGPALLRAIGSHPPDAGPKSPRARLLAATAMLAAAMLVASPDRAAAQSNDACGAVDASGAVVCTPAGNPYPDGIGYATPPAVAGEDVTLPETPVVDLTIVLEPGVQILPDPAAAPAIRLVGHNSGSVNLISDSDNLVVTTGDGQRGISALTQAGDISVLAPAIATYGDFATGLRAISSSGSTQIEAGDLSTHGYASDAIIAAGSSVTVGVGGSVFTVADLSYGAFVRATDGNATVNLSGSIETRGFNAWGVDAEGLDGASVVGPGSIETHGTLARGVTVSSQNGDAVVDLATVRTYGDSASAISASSFAGNSVIRIDSVSTSLGYSNAIQAFSTRGDVSVTAEEARTEGFASTAIFARSGRKTEVAVGSVHAEGEDSGAIVAIGDSVDVAIATSASTSGDAPRAGGGLYQATVFAVAGINPDNDPDSVERSGIVTIRNDGLVSALGYHAAGIVANGQRGVVVTGTGSVATSGGSAVGISTQSYGSILIAQNRVSTSGNESTGIYALGQGDISISGGSVVTTGDGSTAIVARAGGSIAIDQDYVSAAGIGSGGIFAASDSGGIEVNLGSVSSGLGTLGIETHANGPGATRIRLGEGVASGDGATVIFSRGLDDIDIAADTLAANGADARGVNARAYGDGSVTMSAGSASAEGDNGFAISGKTFGSGNVAVTAGSISASGELATGIGIAADNGDVTVAVDQVSATGLLAYGVAATAINGTSRIIVGSAAATGQDSAGVATQARNIEILVEGSITSNGLRSTGIRAGALGTISVVANGPVTANDVAAGGIHIAGDEYASLVARGPILSTGDLSNPVSVNSYNGDVYANLGSVSTTGLFSRGVQARAYRDVTVIIDSASTLGNYSTAIFANSTSGNIRVVSTGTITTENDVGVGAGGRGVVDVTVNDMRVGDSDYAPAVNILAGTGQVTVNGRVESDSASGQSSPSGVITVRTVAGELLPGAVGTANIVNHGEIVAHGDSTSPILADTISDVTITGNGSVRSTSSGSVGIRATTQTGNVDVAMARVDTAGDAAHGALITALQGNSTVAIGTLSTAGSFARGVDLRVGGTASVAGGSISTTGDDAIGVRVRAGGNTSVALEALRTTGDSATGVRVQAGGAIDVSLADGSTTGEAANLIHIGSGGGDARVSSSGLLSVAGAGSTLIDAQSLYSVAVAVNNANVAGDGSRGIFAKAYQDAVVTISGSFTGSAAQAAANSPMIEIAGYDTAALVNTGTIRTSNANEAAVDIRGYAGATISGSGTIITAGDRARGVYAGANTVGVSVSQANIRTAGAGSDALVAMSYGTVLVDVGTAATAGPGSDAVYAAGGYGVSVRAGSVSTTGAASDGIVARSYGPVTIAAGTVTATGAGSLGIDAQSLAGGAVDVSATGAVLADGVAVNAVSASGSANVRVASVTSLGAGANAVSAKGGTTANVSIVAGGTVSARGDTITLQSGSGSSLSNAGIVQAGEGAAVRVLGASATILNSGTMTGALILTANADQVANSGTMALGAGTSFGAGDDRLTNSGALTLGGDVDFGAGSDGFSNSGTLRLAPSAAGSPRTISLVGLESFANSGSIDLRNGVAGDRLTSSGSFAGSGGSVLAVDLGPAGADRLIIGGAATGSTRILVNPLSGTGTLLLSPVTLVQAGAGTSPGAFTLDPASRLVGFVEHGLIHDPAAQRFDLVGAPAPAAYRLARLGEGAQALWHDSADAVFSHLASLRDAAVVGRGFWFTFNGAAARRQESRLVDDLGLVRTIDLGYRQDGYGAQGGFDLGAGDLAFGVTGGYRTSVMRFAGGDRASFDAVNAGVYARLGAGGFFANFLAKYDHVRVRTSLRSIGASDRFQGAGFGGRIEAGYRFGSDAFHVEPSVSLTYANIELDSTGAFGARIDFADREGLRGAAGLRIGSRHNLAGGNVLTIYASGHAMRELNGRGEIAFSTGSARVDIEGGRIGTYGVGKLGASIRAGRVTGFIEAEGRHGEDYRQVGGRAGVTISF